jgi:sulfhydrogenase subunit beta (sulfur reductase)
MAARRIDRASLTNWVNALIQEQTVHGVQARDGRFVFDRLTDAAKLRLDYDVTILSPGKYFLPQREVLCEFDRYKMTFKSVIHDEPFVLFGVHPYDMEAIRQLDSIFRHNHEDVHYLSRRASATIVVCDVQTPSDDVFAGCMGTATCEGRDGFDVLLTRIADDSYLVDARTEKGEALLGALADADTADNDELAMRKQVWATNRKALRKHQLKLNPADLPALLARSEDHPVWQEKAGMCHSCGSCNLVCPTCYCFDVQDELNWDMATGVRTRVLDGCMLNGFAEVAGGHNFRADKTSRYRHRYYRKGKYTFDRFGDISCVGCGRCITACTTKIANPVEIFNRLLEDS